MSYSRRSRYSRSPSPYRRYSRSVSRSVSMSRSLSRSRSRSYDSSEVENPGNNLYVTGLSPRITKRDLEKHFSTEGKVEDVHLVVDPWSRVSRGFGFVTMSTVKEADRCIKYLDRSVLEGRVIMVEKLFAHEGFCGSRLAVCSSSSPKFKFKLNQIKHFKQISDLSQRARRSRGRTPTPGRYLGLKTSRGRRRSPSYSPRGRSLSSSYSSEQGSRSRSYSPYYSRRRESYSPYYGRRRRSYSPYYGRRRYYSRSRSPNSRSPYYYRDSSPDDRYYRSRRSRYNYYYRDSSPDDRYHRRSHYCVSRSISPRSRRYSRRSYSRSASPRRSTIRRYSPSVSPMPRRSSASRGSSSKRGYSEESYSSRSRSPSASSVSRSPSP